MKYPYIVNYDGVWYPAGTDVPVGDIKSPTNKEISEAENHQYSKTEIQRLSVAELQRLAEKEGIVGASEISGSQLKKILVEHFGL